MRTLIAITFLLLITVIGIYAYDKCNVLDEKMNIIVKDLPCHLDNAVDEIEIGAVETGTSIVKMTHILDTDLTKSIDWKGKSIQVNGQNYNIVLVNNSGGQQDHLEIYLNKVKDKIEVYKTDCKRTSISSYFGITDEQVNTAIMQRSQGIEK